MSMDKVREKLTLINIRASNYASNEILVSSTSNSVEKNSLKYATVTVCATDDYAWGSIRCIQRLRWLKTKYDTFIICPPFLKAETYKLFEKNNIPYKVVNDNRLFELKNQIDTIVDSGMRTGSYTVFNILLAYYFTEYDFLFFLEGDMIAKTNIDEYIDSIALNKKFILYASEYLTYLGPTIPSLGLFISQPNKIYYEEILKEAFQHKTYTQEEVLLGDLSENSQNFNGDKYCFCKDTFKTIEANILHFNGELKPWHENCHIINDQFVNYSYEQFNRFIDEAVNKQEPSASLLELARTFLQVIHIFNENWNDYTGITAKLFLEDSFDNLPIQFAEQLGAYKAMLKEQINKNKC